jgi:hypothetical protein
MKWVILIILCIIAPYIIGKGLHRVLFRDVDLGEVITYMLGVDVICVAVIITMMIYGDKFTLWW